MSEMNTYKMNIHIKVLLLAVLVIGGISTEMHGQFAYTRVEINSGIDSTESLLYEKQAEQVLIAANTWILKRENTFKGSQDAFKKLIDIIEPHNAMSIQDTLKTIPVTTEDGNNALHNIAFYKQRGDSREVVSVVLVFNEEAELVDVKEDNPLALAQETLANRSNSKEITEQVQEYVENINRFFNEKDSEGISDILDSSAVVIVGLPNGTKNGIKYKRLTGKEYVSTLSNHAFLPENSLKVNLQIDKVFEHPKQSNLIGVSVKQEWKSNIYTDTGDIFLLFDTQDENNSPKLITRIWQKKPFNFKADQSFKPIQFFPHIVSTGVDKLTTEGSVAQNGTIEIQPYSTSNFYLSASDIRDWISKRTISFSGIDVDFGSLKITTNGSIILNFTGEEGNKLSTKGVLKVSEMFYTASIEKELELYPNRKNRVQISMESPGGKYQPTVQRSLVGKLNLKVNPHHSIVSVFSSMTQPAVIGSFEIDSLVSLSLLEGSYIVKTEKENYTTTETPILVRKGQISFSNIYLNENKPEVLADISQKRGFFKKYKYWIIGSATAIVTTSAIAILRDTQGNPEIPIPPGRPIN